jgi:hypothetical protein
MKQFDHIVVSDPNYVIDHTCLGIECSSLGHPCTVLSQYLIKMPSSNFSLLVNSLE